jgi:hypothetical protein
MESEGFFHVCTKPLETDVYFKSEEAMNLALNAMAIAVFSSGCRLLAFAVMSNHFHFVLEGRREVCRIFFDAFKKHLTKCMAGDDVRKLLKACEAQYISIDNLKQLRDEIAYVVRNPFAARTNVNMFAYRWCSGYLYFNDTWSLFAKGTSASEMTIDARRIFTRSRSSEVDPGIMVLDGTALPVSFVDYKRTESFFENAREFQHCLLKNVESQVTIAKRMGDALALDDHEIWDVLSRLCRNTYKVGSPKELSPEDKIAVARNLKYDYGASNAQISRCLGMMRSAVDQIFPLSARGK